MQNSTTLLVPIAITTLGVILVFNVTTRRWIFKRLSDLRPLQHYCVELRMGKEAFLPEFDRLQVPNHFLRKNREASDLKRDNILAIVEKIGGAKSPYIEQHTIGGVALSPFVLYDALYTPCGNLCRIRIENLRALQVMQINQEFWHSFDDYKKSVTRFDSAMEDASV